MTRFFSVLILFLEHDIPSLLVLFNDALGKKVLTAHHFFIAGLAAHFRDFNGFVTSNNYLPL